MRKLFICFLGLLIASCATATGTLFSPLANKQNETQSILYIYRPDDSTFTGFNASPDVYVGSKKIGVLKRQGYIAVPVELGKKVVSLHGSGLSLGFPPMFQSINVKKDEDVYLRLDVRLKALTSDETATFHVVSKQEALQELESLKLSK